nr:unnamed protein product [Spirometra erinaceieuropaei]
MSQFSVALWNKLPPITERSSCVHRAFDLKSSVSQNTMNVLTPVQTHLQPIEAKRAMLILDDLVTKVLLVGAFPKILSNIETFALLVGDEATNIFRKIEPLAKELDEGITPGSSLRISKLTGSTANQWEISDPIDAFFNPPKNRLAMAAASPRGCENYRGISLIDVAAKNFAIVLLRRFQAVRDYGTRPNQAGFRARRGCADQIFTLRRILKFRHSYQQPSTVCFVDVAAAFDSIHHESLLRIMVLDGVPPKIIAMIKAYYHSTTARVLVRNYLSQPLGIRSGVLQGCILLPNLFKYAIDWILGKALHKVDGLEFAPGHRLTVLDYAYDIALLASSFDDLQSMLSRVNEVAKLVKDTVFSLSRHLIRSLMSNKEACFALLRHYKQWDVEACPAIKHLGSLLVQMRFLVRQALLTTTREKTMREEYQNKTERRMRRQARLIEEMTSDLATQTEEHNKMVNQTKEDIEKVRNALLQMEKDAMDKAKLDAVTAEYEKEHKLHCQLKERFAVSCPILPTSLNASSF